MKKMSFDANVLSVKPVIRETANMNNDGGGGNLGYMQRERQDEEEKEKRFLSEESIFDKKQESDVFVSRKEIEIPEEYKFSLKKYILKFLLKLKKMF